MNTLYPLKFLPIFKDKIWGGNKIHTELNLNFAPLLNCGEAWMLSGVKGNISTVSDGFLKDNDLDELIEVYMGDLVGDKVYEKYENEFPLLIKFIDANDYLSLQVHPDDALAAKRNIGFGKSEMWYVLQADKNAELISGFNQKVDKETYLKHLENKTLKQILNFEQVNKGDVFYIPAGRIHALGPGILLAEIQQTSDTTYRVYDWDRIDENGKSRQLHVEDALDAINFNFESKYKTEYNSEQNRTVTLQNTPYFVTNQLNFNQNIEKNYEELDSFVIYICTEGNFEIVYLDNKVKVKKGEIILLPAEIKKVRLNPENKTNLLEIYII